MLTGPDHIFVCQLSQHLWVHPLRLHGAADAKFDKLISNPILPDHGKVFLLPLIFPGPRPGIPGGWSLSVRPDAKKVFSISAFLFNIPSSSISVQGQGQLFLRDNRNHVLSWYKLLMLH